MRDYVRGMKDVPELLDMLAAPKSETTDADKIVFEEVKKTTLRYDNPLIFVIASITSTYRQRREERNPDSRQS